MVVEPLLYVEPVLYAEPTPEPTPEPEPKPTPDDATDALHGERTSKSEAALTAYLRLARREPDWPGLPAVAPRRREPGELGWTVLKTKDKPTWTKGSAGERLQKFCSDDPHRSSLAVPAYLPEVPGSECEMGVASDGHRLALVPVRTQGGLPPAADTAEWWRAVVGTDAKGRKETRWDRLSDRVRKAWGMPPDCPEFRHVVPTPEQHTVNVPVSAEVLCKAVDLLHKWGDSQKGDTIVAFRVLSGVACLWPCPDAATTAVCKEPPTAWVVRLSRLGNVIDDTEPVFLTLSYLRDALAKATGTVVLAPRDALNPFGVFRQDGERHVIMPRRL